MAKDWRIQSNMTDKHRPRYRAVNRRVNIMVIVYVVQEASVNAKYNHLRKDMMVMENKKKKSWLVPMIINCCQP